MSYPNKIFKKDTAKTLIALCFEYMQWNKYHTTKTKGLMLYVYEQRDETLIAKNEAWVHFPLRLMFMYWNGLFNYLTPWLKKLIALHMSQLPLKSLSKIHIKYKNMIFKCQTCVWSLPTNLIHGKICDLLNW